LLLFEEAPEYQEFLKMMNIDSDVALPSLEMQVRQKKIADRKEKTEEASPPKDKEEG